VVAARHLDLAHGPDGDPAAVPVPDQHVVEVQDRQVGGPGARQAPTALVVGVPEPGVEQPPQGGVVAVGVEVARQDDRQGHLPRLDRQSRERAPPDLLEPGDGGQRVGGEQADGRAVDVDRRAR